MQKSPLNQIKVLWTLTLEEKKTLLIATFFLLLASGLTLYYPMITGEIIDLIKSPQLSPDQIKQTSALISQKVLFLISLFVVMGVATAFRAYLFTLAGERNIKSLRLKLFEALISQDIAFFDQSKTGAFLSRLNEDSTRIQQAVSVNISMLLRYLITSIGAFAILMWISLKLSLLMALLVPTAAGLAGWYGQKLRKLSKTVQDGQANASGIAQEALSGIRTIQSFTAENLIMNQYQNAINGAFELAQKRAKYSAYFQGGMSVLAYLSIAIVVWYGAHLSMNHEISLGDLTSFILYTFTLAFSVGALSSLWEDYMKAIGASEVVFELLSRKSTLTIATQPILQEIKGAIEFQNIRFAYPSRPEMLVLKDLNLKIKPKEVIAIVGSSGAGKSTISALLSRFYEPNQGKILIDEITIESFDLKHLREQIALVSQEPLLFATTIAENIRYAKPNASHEEIIQAAKMANADEFIMKFKDQYESFVGERGVQLSGGQKQRIAIARAILKNPKILILDEATSALDTESEKLVQEALEKLMVDRTTLMIAHRLSTVVGADRILVLQDGHVVEDGKHEVLIEKQGVYYQLVSAQIGRLGE
jgi:ABC-type multidrug transport system fused ATPase/permease subunit